MHFKVLYAYSPRHTTFFLKAIELFIQFKWHNFKQRWNEIFRWLVWVSNFNIFQIYWTCLKHKHVRSSRLELNSSRYKSTPKFDKNSFHFWAKQILFYITWFKKIKTVMILIFLTLWSKRNDKQQTRVKRICYFLSSPEKGNSIPAVGKNKVNM